MRDVLYVMKSARPFQFALIFLDLFFLSLSFGLLHLLRFQQFNPWFLITPTFLGIVFFQFMSNYSLELYRFQHWQTHKHSFIRILLSLALTFLMITFFLYLLAINPKGLVGRGILIGSLGLYGVFSFITRQFILSLIKNIESKLNLIYIGPQKGLEFLKKELPHKQNQVQWVDPTLQTLEQFKILLNKFSHPLVLVDRPINNDWGNFMTQLRLSGYTLFSLRRFIELTQNKIPLYTIDWSWITFTEGFEIFHKPFLKRLKRLFDIGFALILIIIFSPFALLTALAVFINSPGPVIYSHKRVGHLNTIFTIYKFRSMTLNAEIGHALWAQKDDQRITPVGKFIRLTRLDEIPQLINILRGDMSFIGPRPERPEFTKELEKKIPYYNLRHLVKPGLSGWAQINYPYGASVEDAIEKLQYELYYIKNYSLLLDLKVALKTLSTVLFGKGR